MQFVADYFPLLLFFIAFKWQGIYVATGVAIVASVVQIVWFRLQRGKVAPVHWLSLAVILVFGGATLLLHDEAFIKWKPTVLYWLFASILAVGKLFFRRDLIATLLAELKLPDAVWSRVTWSWVGFFAVMGTLNLYVAFNFPLDTWVNFKVWGSMVLILLFVVAQGVMLARHLPEQT